ncbi:MAG: VOC family protein, partial [Gaiellales bacterium]
DEGDAAPLRTAGCCFPGLAVRSVTEVVHRAAAAGVTILQPPSPYPWGLRAVLRDPDGRPFEVFEPVAEY